MTALRIGELARRTGTTPRTIRYYEELGLLGSGDERAAGSHRTYGEADAERLEELMRLRDLLGLSLDELKEVAEAEEHRAVLREEWHGGADEARRREIAAEILVYVERQLELAGRRRVELDELYDALAAKRERLGEIIG
jgi:MerR family transcriptional regulator, repressor of the yfmOP operon